MINGNALVVDEDARDEREDRVDQRDGAGDLEREGRSGGKGQTASALFRRALAPQQAQSTHDSVLGVVDAELALEGALQRGDGLQRAVSKGTVSVWRSRKPSSAGAREPARVLTEAAKLEPTGRAGDTVSFVVAWLASREGTHR